jgi:hypothetical protein
MTDAQIAELASHAPEGFTPVFEQNGRFSFIATSELDRMSPTPRATLTVVQRRQ